MLDEQSQVHAALVDAEPRVLEAGNPCEPGIRPPRLVERLELPQHGVPGGLQVERGAVHDFIARRQDDGGRVALGRERGPSVSALRQQARLPAGAVEVGHADVEIPDRLRPPDRVVDALAARAGLVGGPFGIDERLRAKASLAPRKRPLAKPGQHEEIDRPPVADEGEVDERLAELVLAVDVLHEVRLVDDVDQVIGLGDSPEHPADADAKVRGVEHPLVQQLAHIEVGALVVRGIEPQEGREQQALLPVVELVVELRLNGERETVTALARMGGRVREATRLELDSAGRLDRAHRQRRREQRGRNEHRPTVPGGNRRRLHRRAPMSVTDTRSMRTRVTAPA